jgi:hypothetical protein
MAQLQARCRLGSGTNERELTSCSAAGFLRARVTIFMAAVYRWAFVGHVWRERLAVHRVSQVLSPKFGVSWYGPLPAGAQARFVSLMRCKTTPTSDQLLCWYTVREQVGSGTLHSLSPADDRSLVTGQGS